MNMPGHWRVIIVSHNLRQVLLLDPFGDGFTNDEFDSVRYSYIGYNVSTWTKRLQTDSWNCGVWVAWVASLWTTHVEQGLEGTKDIGEVIQEGLSAMDIQDINTHPSGKSHNENCILQMRKQFQRRIYDESIPAHLTTWLDHWNTPLRDIQAVTTITNLPRSHHTMGTTDAPLNLPENMDNTDSTPPPPFPEVGPTPTSGGPPPPLRGEPPPP